MSRRLIVVGGDAAGMSAASTAKRRAGEHLEVLVFECGRWTSYSACGIPYWIGGTVDGPEGLVARSPEEHRANGIDVRMESEVVAVDPDAGRVTVRADRAESSYGYDDLLIATGAQPVRPDIPGIDAAGVYGVQSLGDGEAIIAGLESGPERVVVVGSGYIGLEMAEACVRRGLDTVLVDQAETPMGTLDPDLGEQINEAMQEMEIDVRMSTPVTEFATGSDGSVRGVVTDAGTIDADLVVLGIGVRARSDLAESAGLPIGRSGAITVDPRQRVDAGRHVWAAGDCVESYDRILRAPVHVPLGTHANKQGRVAGLNLAA
ncbi:MAG: NAD(P)/FAD-dependent oxidoreductase, partial [Nocardioidaceae bacterium]